MEEKARIRSAFLAAFPHTVPIMASFVFLGATYGVYLISLGFSPLYPVLMSMFVFAGSAEFAAAGLLVGVFDPVGIFLLTVTINARHLFYGISMLERYAGTGWKKPYLLFGMCDESFSINCTADIPPEVDRGWFMLFVTLLNHVYWVTGATLGGLFGSLVRFRTEGLSFAMTALFIVLFIEQWQRETRHHSALLGVAVSLGCLAVFGGERFVVPAMVAILGVLSALRRPLLESAEIAESVPR